MDLQVRKRTLAWSVGTIAHMKKAPGLHKQVSAKDRWKKAGKQAALMGQFLTELETAPAAPPLSACLIREYWVTMLWVTVSMSIYPFLKHVYGPSTSSGGTGSGSGSGQGSDSSDSAGHGYSGHAAAHDAAAAAAVASASASWIGLDLAVLIAFFFAMACFSLLRPGTIGNPALAVALCAAGNLKPLHCTLLVLVDVAAACSALLVLAVLHHAAIFLGITTLAVAPVSHAAASSAAGAAAAAAAASAAAGTDGDAITGLNIAAPAPLVSVNMAAAWECFYTFISFAAGFNIEPVTSALMSHRTGPTAAWVTAILLNSVFSCVVMQVGSSTSGAWQNPAAAFGTGVVQHSIDWKVMMAYWVGPILGAVCIGLLLRSGYFDRLTVWCASRAGNHQFEKAHEKESEKSSGAPGSGAASPRAGVDEEKGGVDDDGVDETDSLLPQ